jgi:hypothetical protein
MHKFFASASMSTTLLNGRPCLMDILPNEGKTRYKGNTRSLQRCQGRRRLDNILINVQVWLASTVVVHGIPDPRRDGPVLVFSPARPAGSATAATVADVPQGSSRHDAVDAVRAENITAADRRYGDGMTWYSDLSAFRIQGNRNTHAAPGSERLRDDAGKVPTRQCPRHARSRRVGRGRAHPRGRGRGPDELPGHGEPMPGLAGPRPSCRRESR